MADSSQPNKNPANDGTLLGTINTILRNYMMDVDDMLPATVIAYDRVANVATVKPQILMVTTDNETVQHPQFATIPVFSFGGGGIGISFPLQPGDSGWIKANDRDISLYLQSQSEAAPNTHRMHSFRDGLFFPDVLRKLVVAGSDDDALVIQLLDGTSKISLHRTGQIEIVSTATIDITAPNLNITADIATTGTLTNNGIDVGSPHYHQTPGGGNTTPPVG